MFLGGSCNPTTWRVDAAVPTLHNAGITCFNPQVDEWFPELIEVEEQAKMAATLLLFVVDSQTRAISSMVEIAFLAGQQTSPIGSPPLYSLYWFYWFPSPLFPSIPLYWFPSPLFPSIGSIALYSPLLVLLVTLPSIPLY